ncbi:MAG: agglutinin biogenesis protein MshI [Burkholderiales bacterium]
MLKGRKASGLVAVSLQSDRVDVARVRREGDRHPIVELCTSFPKHGSDAETLEKLRRELNLSRSPCTCLLPARQYQLQVIDSPSVPEAELKSAVRWRLIDFLDYPVETATVDMFRVPADPSAPTRQRWVYALAARNETISACMSAFAEAKLPLSVIDIPEMAQRNLARLFEAQGQGLAMLSFGEERGLLTFTAAGELYFSRSIDITAAQLVSATGELREQLIDRVVFELQRSLDHFDRQFSFLPLSKLMVAPLPEDVGLESYLMQHLYVTVEMARIETVLDIQSQPILADPAIQGQYLLSLGAALRNGTGVH